MSSGQPLRRHCGCIHSVQYVVLLFVLLSHSAWGAVVQPTHRALMVEGEALTIEIIPSQLESPSGAKTKARLLWLPSEYGLLPAEKRSAIELAQQGIESWFIDFYTPLFLAPTASAVDQIPESWTIALLEQARQDTVPTWIIASNKAAQTAIRALSTYLKTPKKNLGLILMNPNLYLNTPRPGQTADYWPQVFNSNLPISIFQSELSPWRWRVIALQSALSQGGSDVFVHLLPKVRDRFYFRPDALPIEQKSAKTLPAHLLQAMRLQTPYLTQSRQVNLPALTTKVAVSETRSVELQPYQGAQRLGLSLPNMAGVNVQLNDYKGKVVLVNFWASWCPPCVHEMPSMARLKNLYKQSDFEILAVNLGEDKTQVDQFLNAHPVSFPVLLDKEGRAVKDWQVFAYPSSYLIDKKGIIRWALFGGTEWDKAPHLDKINALLAE